MDEVTAGLRASAPVSLPFDPTLRIRSFLLQRDAGSLLLYAAPSAAAEVESIEDLGGVSRNDSTTVTRRARFHGPPRRDVSARRPTQPNVRRRINAVIARLRAGENH